MKRTKHFLPAALLLAGLMPASALACACGCGVFDVGTGAMMPVDTGGTVWFEYDFMNQSQNWHGTDHSAKANNEDKQIRTNYFTLGGQYMFNRSWGAMAELPYINRHFKTTNEDTGDLNHFQRDDFGDARISGIYSGFSEDMSTGVTFGFKLPTGDFNDPHFDRDTSLGSGSTNILLGGYQMGALDEAGEFTWFTNALWDYPVLTQGGYRPGTEANLSVGSYYNAMDWGPAGKFSPLLQLAGTYRLRDSGAASDPANTGYKRLLISPGFQYSIDDVKLYGDIGFPIFQDVNGQQLTSTVYFKLVVGYSILNADSSP